jgi:hypothetical protein
MVCEPCVVLFPQWSPTCLQCGRTYPLIDGTEYPGCVCYDLDDTKDLCDVDTLDSLGDVSVGTD